MLNNNQKLINAYKALFQALIEPAFSNEKLNDSRIWSTYIHHRLLYRAFLLEKILEHNRITPANYWNFYKTHNHYNKKTYLYSEDFVNFIHLQYPLEKPLKVNFTVKAQEALATVDKLTKPYLPTTLDGKDDALNASCLLLMTLNIPKFTEATLDIQTAFLILKEIENADQVQKVISLTSSIVETPAFNKLKDNFSFFCKLLIEKTEQTIQDETNLLSFLKNSQLF